MGRTRADAVAVAAAATCSSRGSGRRRGGGTSAGHGSGDTSSPPASAAASSPSAAPSTLSPPSVAPSQQYPATVTVVAPSTPPAPLPRNGLVGLGGKLAYACPRRRVILPTEEAIKRIFPLLSSACEVAPKVAPLSVERFPVARLGQWNDLGIYTEQVHQHAEQCNGNIPHRFPRRKQHAIAVVVRFTTYQTQDSPQLREHLGILCESLSVWFRVAKLGRKSRQTTLATRPARFIRRPCSRTSPRWRSRRRAESYDMLYALSTTAPTS